MAQEGIYSLRTIHSGEEIRARYPKCRILFVGAHGRMEADKVPEAGYEILLLED